MCITHSCLSWLQILGDSFRFLALCLRPKTSLAAENLFLRKQLAFYQERKVKPRRADNPTRLTLVLLGRWFNWRGRFDRGEAQNLRRVAPQGLPPFLALEVRGRSATDTSRTSTSDSPDGAREPHLGRCVQRRLARSVGNSPTKVRVSSLVAWMAGRRETNDLKPIDRVVERTTASHRAAA